MRRQEEGSFFGNLDWITIGLYFLLVLMGWGNIYAAVFDEEHSSIFDLSQRYGKQMIFIACALVIALAIIIIDASFFTATAYVIFGAMLFLNILVIFIGKEVKGSHSWFKFGDFGVQPAEFMKFAIGLALAKLMSDVGVKKNEASNILKAFAFMVVPILIIMILQNETGAAIVIVAFVGIFYREGMIPGIVFIAGLLPAACTIIGIKYRFETVTEWIIVGGILAGVATLALLFMRRTILNVVLVYFAAAFLTCLCLFSWKVVDKLPSHQTGRIKVWLGYKEKLDTVNMERRAQQIKDIQEREAKYGYNVKQSTIAIGSGGFTGKGYLEGTQTKFNFVPEQETDFIFCTVGEEWGFLGTSAVILLFSFFIIRIIIMAERQRSDFSRIYGYGVAGIFLFHLIVNIGMTIGLVPVIGIPLPFFSYGGSSLWAFTILLFIFIRLDAERLNILR